MKRRNLVIAFLSSIILSTAAWAESASEARFLSDVKLNQVDAVRKALQQGLNPNTADKNKNTALILALQNQAADVADLLIADEKTDINALNATDENALMFAVIRGLKPQAEALVARGGHVNKTGWAPLHYACSQSDLEVVKLLIENSAYIDAWSPNRTTPLMMAASYGTDEQVAYLLEQGADPNLVNDAKYTAYDFAKRGERKKAMQLILAAMKKTQPSGW